MPRDDFSTSNILLAGLPAEDLALLKPGLHRVDLTRDMVLVEPDRPIRHIHFLEGGVASIVSAGGDGVRTETGIIGREGMTGTALLLGTDQTPQMTFVQIGGATALRIEAGCCLAAVAQSASLRLRLLRYVHTLVLQTAQGVVANARHRIEARLARWLLMCHDRLDGDEMALTHGFMSMMIGAERSGVTVSLHGLEGAGMIRSSRGRVVILDRAKLAALAGTGYGRPEQVYRQLIGPFGRGLAA